MNRRPLAVILATIFIVFQCRISFGGPEPPRYTSKVSFWVDADWLDGRGFISLQRCVPFRRHVCPTTAWTIARTEGPIDPLPGHEAVDLSLNPYWWGLIGDTFVEWSIVSNPEWAIRFHRNPGSFDPHRWFIQCEQDKTDPALWTCFADVSGGWVAGDEVAEYVRKQWDNGPVLFLLTVQAWTRAYDGEQFSTVSTAHNWEPNPVPSGILPAPL